MRPEVILKVKPETGPNPTRKARPDLQLCCDLLNFAYFFYIFSQTFTLPLIIFLASTLTDIKPDP